MSRIAFTLAAVAFFASAPAFAMTDRDAALNTAIAHQMEVTSYFGGHAAAPTTPSARATTAGDDYIALSVQRERQFGTSFLR